MLNLRRLGERFTRNSPTCLRSLAHINFYTMKFLIRALSILLVYLGESVAQNPRLSVVAIRAASGAKQALVRADGSFLTTGTFLSSPTEPVTTLALLDASGRLLRRLPPLFVPDRAQGGRQWLPDPQLALADGSLLIGAPLTNSPYGFQLFRLKPDGSVDEPFRFRFGTNLVQDLALQLDGRILVAGEFAGMPLRRIQSDGSVDEDFSRRLTTQGLLQPAGEKVAVHTDGRIVLKTYGGSPEQSTALVRLLPDGTRDTSFRPAHSMSNFLEWYFLPPFFPLPNGKLLNGLTRLDSDGSVDTSFQVSAETFVGAGVSAAAIAERRTVVVAEAALPDGSVYVHGATLFALASDGGIRWSQATTSTVLPKSVPVIDTNGTVYVGANDSLVAFAPDGSKRWVYTAPSSTGTASIDVAPAIGADGSILQPVTGTAQATLAALDPASGTVRSLGYGENAHVDLTPIVDGGGWVYYVAGDNKLYGVDGNGQNPWSLQLPTMINGAPALGTGSVLYLSGNDGKLYAIGP